MNFCINIMKNEEKSILDCIPLLFHCKVLVLIFGIMIPLQTQAQPFEYQFFAGQAWGGGKLDSLENENTEFFNYANLLTTNYENVRYAEYYNTFINDGPYVKKTNNIKLSFKGTSVGNFFSQGVSINYSQLLVGNIKKYDLYNLYLLGILNNSQQSQSTTDDPLFQDTANIGILDRYLTTTFNQYVFYLLNYSRETKAVHAGSFTWDLYFHTDMEDFNIYTRFSLPVVAMVRVMLELFGSRRESTIKNDGSNESVLDSAGFALGTKYRVYRNLNILGEVYADYYFNSSIGYGVYDIGGRMGVAIDMGFENY